MDLLLSLPPSVGVGVSTTAYVLFAFTAIFLSGCFMARSARESGEKCALPEDVRRIGGLLKFVPLFAGLAPALLYVALPFNGWILPGWAKMFSLPDVEGKVRWQSVAAGMALVNYVLFTWSLCVLGQEGIFSPLEVKQRHLLVDDGPFAIVRHPNYLSLLLWPIIMTLSFWNAAPLLQYLGLSLLLAKIPYEEKLLEDEKALGRKYIAYKERVPHRILPFLW